VWTGVHIIDKPMIVSRKDLYVMPGTKVMFRGEGRLEVQFGSMYAANAEFSADSVMTGNLRIFVKRPPKMCWFDNCRFTGLKCVKPANWGSGFFRSVSTPKVRAPVIVRHCTFSDSSSISFERSAGSEIVNCLFENGVSGVCALLSLDTFVSGCVFRNASAYGVELRQADTTDVVGNVFENNPHGTLFSLCKDCRLIGNIYENCTHYKTAREGKNKLLIEPLVVNE
jgi:hypothetical protein